MELPAPEPLGEEHLLDAFACGEPVLDEWLRRWARHNQASGASRTYVLHDHLRVIGYYCLAAGGIDRARSPGKVRRNMPDPVPVIVLGRLAVDESRQGAGLGPLLLRDAAKRVLNASTTIGVRALLVHALHDQARRFYLRQGFTESPIEPLTLMATVAELRAALK